MARRLLLPSLVLLSFNVYASEPNYCDPTKFTNYEVRVNQSGLNRAREFKIGSLSIVGVGVGSSSTQALQKLALQHSITLNTKKYCTWYFNQGNQEAEQAFIHQPLSKPTGSQDKVSNEFYNKLHVDFEIAAPSFITCAAEEHYIAMGCNSQKHRGPSVFAMFLAYSGCTPEHSVQIANQLWGENGIPTENRLALARMASNLAVANPQAQQLLKSAMQ